MSAAPTVSVITAAYNGAELIVPTINSVLRQSFADFEMVIVDDCSTDHTRDVLAGFGDPRIRVIHAEENRGPIHTRNRAMAAARGRYIAGLDQDDICHPDKLVRQVAFLDSHADVALVATDVELLEDGRITASVQPPVTTPDTIDWYLQVRNILAWSTTMFRADVARRLDPITRPEMLYAEDFDFYHRIRSFGRIARIDEPLLMYRCHPGGVSKRFRDVSSASAARVLAEVHGDLFGARAGEVGTLVVTHVMSREPVPNAATLRMLTDAILTIRADYLARRQPDAETRAAIDREISRQWWALCRAGVRSGRLSLRDIWAAQPAEILREEADSIDLVMSQIVGRMRKVGRRTGR